MTRVFVSHCASDKERFVDDLAQRLVGEGFEVWYDSWALLPGDSLTERIFGEGLGGSDVVIVVLSVNSIDSAWVREELNVATVRRIGGKCRLIPVLLDDVAVPPSLVDAVYQRIPDTSSYDFEFGRIAAGIGAGASSGGRGFSSLGVGSGGVSDPCFPSAPRRFVNREDELAILDGLLDESANSNYPCVAVLVGMPGVGKSALAAQWGSSVRDRFSDGELYVDFAPRGRDPQPDMTDILGGLLLSLGVDENAIPTGLASRQDAYRRLTASKRLLLVADNVTEPGQVRQALPRGGGSVAVVTAAEYMGELAVDVDVSADVVEVKSLESEDSVALLRAMAGPRAERDSVKDLEELGKICGGLPIALAFCGSHLRRRERWSVREFIDDIRSADDTLAAVAGDRVKGPLSAVYRRFGDDMKAFYRRIGLFPGSTLSSATAAVAAGVSQPEAARMLRELHDAQLLIDARGGRYAVHDLVLEHMGRVCADEEPSGSVEVLGAGLVEWYFGALRRADRAIAKQRLRVAADEDVNSPIGFPEFSTPSEAYGWYMVERHNIVAVMHLADGLGHRDRVWKMAEALWVLLLGCRATADWQECDTLGAQAAAACGHRDAEARLRSHLARAFAEQGDHEQARRELSSALDLVAMSDNLALRASIRESEGTCLLLEGDHAAALEAFDDVRAQMEGLGRARSVAIADLLRSRALHALQRFAEALDAARSCEPVFARLGDEANAAKAALEAARASVRCRSDDEVVAEIQNTADVLGRLGLAYHCAQAHELAGGILDSRSRDDEATRHWEHAYRLYSELGHDSADRVRKVMSSRG